MSENQPNGKDKLIYIRDYIQSDSTDSETRDALSAGEPHRIELEFDSELTIWELNRIFRRLCLSMGYTEDTVNSAIPYDAREDERLDSIVGDGLSEYFESLKSKTDTTNNPTTEPKTNEEVFNHNWESFILEEIQRIMNNNNTDTDN